MTAIFDEKAEIKDSLGSPITVQNPFPINGDAVYAKDINLSLSDIGSFTGSIEDLFNDYSGTNIAASVLDSGTNPKSFKVVLERPVLASTIGIGSPNTSLSNAKLILRGLDGAEFGYPGDYSLDDTKRGLVFFNFEQTAFLEAEVFFYTDDEVTVGGMTIFKSQTVTIGAIDGLMPFAAQTNTPLLANETWISETIDAKNYVWIIGNVYADVDSAIDGFKIEASTNGIDWRWSSPYTIFADDPKTFSEQAPPRYIRIKYTNGPADQTVFDLATKISPIPSKSSSHRLKDVLSGEDDCEAVKAGIMGFSDLTGVPENVATFRGALSTSDGLRHKVGLNLKFHQPDTVATTLAAATLPGDVSIPVVDATGFTIGMDIEIYSGSVTGELFFRITDLPGANIIVLDQPIPIALPIGNAVENTILNMNVLGTLAAPQIFYIGPPPGSIWQLTRLLISMTDTTAMDDGTFGGRAALPNGVLIRQLANGSFGNAAIWKTNGDIAGDMYDTSYVPKPPAGTGYGFRARWTLQAMEAVVELNGDTGDQLQILVQDDLTPLDSFNMKSQGRLYGG